MPSQFIANVLTSTTQVLAVDLLNPTPQAEARKHKLKVCRARQYGILNPCIILTQLDSRPCPPIILHGRQVPRLLHHHHRLLTRPDRRHLRRLLNGAMSTHRRQGSADGGLLIPKKVE
jgi:hypothetical protein